MKRYAIVLLIMMISSSLFAQCFERNYNYGKRCYEQKEFEKAISIFENAKLCADVPKTHDVDEWIKKCRDSLKVKVPHKTAASVTTSGKDIIIKVDGVSYKMVFVEGGTFTMGCAAAQDADCTEQEQPTHKVTLDGYYIGETEVVQALWRVVMKSNPSTFLGDNNPVENVSLFEILTFVKKLNTLTGLDFYLPSEAQWEFAARGGNLSKGYKFSGGNSLNEVAWYSMNANKQPHPVKTRKANELGLYDMSGNVWEWCSDHYVEYGDFDQKNPVGEGDGTEYVRRGGCWSVGEVHCRSTFRYGVQLDYKSYYLGFRLALSK